jgi:toxin ParE1/3/4
VTSPVFFAPEAVDQLQGLYDYISRSATPTTAAGYVDAIVEHCEGLAVAPSAAGATAPPDIGARCTLVA